MVEFIDNNKKCHLDVFSVQNMPITYASGDLRARSGSLLVVL